MCGICGIHHPGAPAHDDEVRRMAAAIVHRGPDSDGFLSADGLALGMRRLAIIDLAGGDQPLHNEDGSVGVVLNGEIYNFRELRDELRGRGHVFATHSDTETIAHGYEEWGDGVCDHLRGMFAFALWDGPRRRLLVARDRFGKKPLYYARTPEGLRFASEIKCLLAAGVSSDIDDEGLRRYLHLRYVPAPRTMFRAVSQLPPGHLMVADDEGVHVRRWWRLAYGPKRDVGLEEASRETERLLRDSVEHRMISDVPLGCFLSGGLDSSMVLATMTDIAGPGVETFSVGFDEGWAQDELPAARSTAATFGANHHEFRLGPGDFLDLLPEAVWYRDEPLAEPSEVPLLALSRAARQHVTVVLSGEGGDELMGGYPKYRVDRLFARLGGLAGPVLRSRAGRSAVGRVRPPHRVRIALDQLALDRPADRWPAWFGAAAASGLRMTGAGPLDERLRDLPRGLGMLDAMMALDVESYMVDNLLIRGDKMTMAASIEGRMPLLDHHLAEYVARLPQALKADTRETKIVMRAIARRTLPPALLDRPKVGFAVPLAPWFRGDLAPCVRELVLGPRAAGRALVEPERAQGVVDAHLSGRYDLGKEVWTLVVLELWARVFLDGSPVDEVRDDLHRAAGSTRRGGPVRS